jgi:hypothetical protein
VGTRCFANINLATTQDGSALMLGGEPAYVQILSRPASKAFPEASPFVKLVAKVVRST